MLLLLQQRATVEQCAGKCRNVWVRRRSRREWTASSSLGLPDGRYFTASL